MYRIALQMTPATPTRPATFQYLSGAGTAPWEVESKTEGLEKYQAELENYKRSVISLVKIIDVELECRDADPSCEYDKDGDGVHDDLQTGKDPEKDPEENTDPEKDPEENTDPKDPEEETKDPEESEGDNGSDDTETPAE